ncbi:hypothetical protein FB451DRAFT_1173375 [Mycena latifolia]|nr:hypothetical protein FB451DRAFT_1173375 [Mycena latifolia]
MDHAALRSRAYFSPSGGEWSVLKAPLPLTIHRPSHLKCQYDYALTTAQFQARAMSLGTASEPSVCVNYASKQRVTTPRARLSPDAIAAGLAGEWVEEGVGLPTVPVFTGVTGAVNGRPSRPVEHFLDKIYGRVRDGKIAARPIKVPPLTAVYGLGCFCDSLAQDLYWYISGYSCLTPNLAYLGTSRQFTVDGRIFALPSRHLVPKKKIPPFL